MASVLKDGGGWRIRFYDGNGERRQIRLPGINKATAEKIGPHVDVLNSAKTSNDRSPDRQTALWLQDLGQTIHDKLSAAGLVTKRSSALLTEFMAEFLKDGKTTQGKPAAPNTVKKWKQAEKVLNEYFGNKDLRDISHDDAAKFRRWLDAGTLNENAKRTHVSVAKMFLNVAKRRKLVDENPFEFEKASLVLNRSRDFYLSRVNAMKIVDACPDNQWRLIFALWRFAALRKMEIFQLRWEHVLWDQGRMLVTIPKTAHHEGKELRYVPIGDILPWLEKAFDDAPEGTERVITRFTETNVNLAKPFEKIIEAAGLTVWPKLIQNLRGSCETDWLDGGNPAHVVARWVGHSVKVQNDNYAQVDDHHFEQFNAKAQSLRAEAGGADIAPPVTKIDEEDGQVGHEVGHTACDATKPYKHRKEKNPVKTNGLRGSDEAFAILRNSQVPEAGVEQSQFEQGFKALSESGGTSGGTLAPDSDSDGGLKAQALDDLQRAWKSLRRMETLSDGPTETKVAERALVFVNKAFAELEGGGR